MTRHRGLPSTSVCPMTDTPPPDSDRPIPGPGAESPTSGPPRRTRQVLAISGGSAALAVVILLVILIVRPAPAAPTPTPAPVASATPTPAVSPTPTPTKSGTGSNEEQQQKVYRAYVTTILVDGTSLVADTANITSCHRSRVACVRAIETAQVQAVTFQRNLNKTPPPACLTDADSRLRTGLGLYLRGLQTSGDAVKNEDRVHLVQGLLLMIAGGWGIGQALHSGRQARC